jgi:hypothetical protein
MSYRRRPHRQVAVLILAASLVAATFASPAAAALATVDFGGGVTPGIAPAGHSTGATPQQVSPGKVAGFHIWVLNRDTAKLNTFYMRAVSTAAPLGAYWSRNGGAPQPCSITSDGLGCTFGALESGDVLNITAAFTLPPGTSTSDPNCAKVGEPGVVPTGGSWRCVDFQFASGSGFVPGKNKSRGDLYHWKDFVRTDTLADEAAQFPFCDLSDDPLDCDSSLLTINNGTNVNKNNVQTTELTAPDDAFDSVFGTTGLAVADNTGLTCPSGTTLCAGHQGTTGNNGFQGQWSKIDVNSETLYPDAFIKVTLMMYGVSPNSVDGVIHLWQTSVQPEIWDEIDITADCASAAEPPANDPECIWVTGSGNVTTVIVWLHNNGRARTF